MSEHTEGWLEGWYFSGDHRHPKVAGQVVCCGRNWLVDIKPSVVNPIRAEGIAIARLLVKAPEMLEALRRVLSYCLVKDRERTLWIRPPEPKAIELIAGLVREIEGGDDE